MRVRYPISFTDVNSTGATAQGNSKDNPEGQARAAETWLAWAGAAAFAAVLASWLVFLVVSGRSGALNMVDLTVYRDGGLIVRHVTPFYDPAKKYPLYDWHGYSSLKLQFTYTPFAAIAYALVSFIPTTPLDALSVIVNMICLPAALWFTFGALGYRDRRVRLGVALLAAAVTFWLQPVVRTIYLGQVNLILMAAITWDLTQADYTKNGKYRWWKGAATGIAAGIKLTPLIFVPYLLVTRKWREAAAARAHHPADGVHPRGHGPVVPRLGARRHSRHHRRLPARAGGLPCGRDSDDRADRAAGLPDQLGPPLGLDRARGRGRGTLRDQHGPQRREGDRPVALAGDRRDDLHLRCLARRALHAGPQPRQVLPRPALASGEHRAGRVRPDGDSPSYPEYHWHGFQLIWGNAYILGGMALLLFLLVIAFRVRRQDPLVPS